MRIHDLLVKRQQGLFLGRERESALLRRLLAESDAEWKLLHIYGPGGIGKSTLLRLFAEEVGPGRCILLDGSAGLATPDALLRKLQQELARMGVSFDDPGSDPKPESVMQQLNAYADAQGAVLVACDAFEKWRQIEPWLRDEWLPRLSPRVRLCTAGRFPLQGRWQGSGWNLLVHNVQLTPLSPENVAAYGRACGIAEPAAIEALKRISGGHPLALALASEAMLKHGLLDFERIHQNGVVQRLMSELLQDIGDPALHLCLEAAAVVRRFDQELLQVILGEPIPIDRFRALCRLPFMAARERYWMLQGWVRRWALADLKARKPCCYDRYRARACAALRRRSRQGPRRTPGRDGRSAAGEHYDGNSPDQAAPPSGAELAAPTLAEVSTSLRRALRRFDHLHLHAALVEPLRFLLGSQPAGSADAAASQLQARILRAVERLESGTEPERIDGEILCCAFLRKEGSHERAAERLNLSVPTYYRHLRLAVHRLAQELLRTASQT